MDMRAFGKDFDKYYERAKAEYGVRFVRARISDVNQSAGNGRLSVRYAAESGSVAEDEFDMVVLSVGLEPAEKTRLLAEKLGVRLDPNGFVWTEPSSPLQTSRNGIFVGGVASGPKDIPETVTQASGAAGKASQLLAEARHTLSVEQQFPPERDITGEPPRIGVFVCHCGINIGGTVDVPDVVQYVKDLPDVVYAEDNLYTCSQDTQYHIREMILEHNLNRVVVASCSPRTHEPLFQQTLKEAGLNPYLFEMANIRDHCSWVHMNEPVKATEKAKDLVCMAIAKVRFVEPLSAELIGVTPSALVIGGGLAGMSAAFSIAEQGFQVTLIERDKRLGGNLKRLRYTLSDPDIPAFVDSLTGKVENHRHIAVHTRTELINVEGFVGNFESTLRSGKKEAKIKHGVVVVATGGNEHKPEEYHYGTNKNVVTQLELEDLLSKCDSKNQKSEIKNLKSIVMIQCVGSREQGHMYCSRVCCGSAVKNALKIKELSPETEVTILYRDVRTYGLNEEYYQQARDKGVVFIRYDLDSKPQVNKDGGLTISVHEPMLDRRLVLRPELLVLSTRIDVNAGNESLAQLLKIPVNEDRFFLEAHAKLRPVEFATEGIFVAGLAHSPKSIPETIAQAEAAAAKVCTILSKDKYEAEPRIAEVDIDRCSACGTCEQVCAYKAIEVIVVNERTGMKAAQVNPALCKGCGTCAATCRSGAVDVKGMTDRQVNLAIQAGL